MTPPKVLIADAISQRGVDELSRNSELDVSVQTKLSPAKLIEIIPGPDFPTGGIVCGRAGILDGYRTGRGKLTLRARASINEEGARTQIIIHEVPYQQTREPPANETISDPSSLPQPPKPPAPTRPHRTLKTDRCNL